jgi:hypothetical protein
MGDSFPREPLESGTHDDLVIALAPAVWRALSAHSGTALQRGQDILRDIAD